MGFEPAPPPARPGPAAGRAAGMRIVALTTTHTTAELAADMVVRGLSAVSAQVEAAGVTIRTAGRD
ncbi:hypothetical protein [Streptomyces sp. NPDC002602]|uniref:hypothetical protein n=1 Tax=Streptomyces sp. NPDC002602 TaxID=3364654 RepID=UPI00367ADB1D